MSRAKERRQLRRLARRAFATAAEDTGLSRLEFARLVKARDQDALAALALAAPDEAHDLGIDWDSIDWDKLIETIMKFIEMFLAIFMMF